MRDVLRDAAQFEKKAPAQTNYHRLMDRLVRWQEQSGAPIALVSFNYDTMLDNAVETVAGITFRDLSSYVANERLRLFKPHGSVNCARVVAKDPALPTGHTAANTESLVLDLALKKGIELVAEYYLADTAERANWDDRILVPALTVPIQQKLDFECPPGHIDLLRESLRQLKWVLSIGWRAGEQNFLKLWRECEPYTQPRLVSGNGRAESGDSVVKTLQAASLRFSETYIVGGFTQLLKDETLKLLLQKPFNGLG